MENGILSDSGQRRESAEPRLRGLITGGAGYIGSVTVDQLVEHGHAVTVFDNLSQGKRNAVSRQADFVHGDLADHANIDAVMEMQQFRPDVVMHISAKRSAADPPGTLLATGIPATARYFSVRVGAASQVWFLKRNLGSGARRKSASQKPGKPSIERIPDNAAIDFVSTDIHSGCSSDRACDRSTARSCCAEWAVGRTFAPDSCVVCGDNFCSMAFFKTA